MKTVDYKVRVGIVNKLRGNVMLNGSAIPVRSRVVTSSTPGTYIYMPRQSSDNGSSKQYFSTDHSIDIEIVHRSVDGAYSTEIDSLTNQVLEILAQKDMIDMPDIDGLVDFEYVRSTQLNDYGATYTILRNILTFELIIDEG